MDNQIIEVETKLIKGKFFWCGNIDSSCQGHFVRTSKKAKSINVLYLTYKKLPGIDYYTLRQTGNDFDFQHNTYPEQPFLLISLTERQDLDLSKPFYLFSKDLKYSSKPIHFLNDILLQKEDNCSICLKNINFDDLAILSCGHSFHNDCILQTTTTKSCFNCNYMIKKKLDYSELGLNTPKSEHYFNLKCPWCQEKVV